MKKEYIYESVTYGFSARKWKFTNGSFSYYVAVKIGQEVAHKIAHLIHAGLLRTKSNALDGLARANIDKLVKKVSMPIED